VTGGLILAAGRGSRFGSPKQLADLGGQPLIAHAADAMLALPQVQPVVVAVGANAERVAGDACLEGVEILNVPDWEEGIAASLRAGIARLDASDSVVVTLADQPFVTPQLIHRVLDHSNGSGLPARATFEGAPGHPVVIRRELFAGVKELQGDDGARDLLEAAGCVHVECAHLASGLDVDTTEDLKRARRESAAAGKESK